MAGDERRGRLDRPIAFRGVEVGVADAGGQDLDEGLAAARHWNGEGLDLQVLAEFGDYCGLHCRRRRCRRHSEILALSSVGAAKACAVGRCPSASVHKWCGRGGSIVIRPARVCCGLEEAELVLVVADQEVLGLLVVVQHHRVVLAADAGGLVAAERGTGRVGVVVVDPHAAGLDFPAGAVGDVAVAGPDAGAEAVEGVVGDAHGVVVVAEAGHGHHRAEDLLLEDPHLVVAFEDGGLDVVAAGQVAGQFGPGAAGEDLGALLLSDVDVGEDLLQLVVGGLGAELGVGVQRVALDDLLGPGHGVGHEGVVDAFLDQGAGRAGADLALVEGEQGEAFQGLVVERVVGVGDVVEEDVGALAAEFQGDRDQVLAGVLADQAAGGGFAGEGDLADPGAGGERLAGLDAEAVDHVDDAGRQQVADELHQHQDRGRGLLGRLEDDGVAGGERGGELPDGHEDREVPRDDLADDAERLVEVVGGGVVVELGQPALLGADGGGEVAEVVGGERDVGVEGLADRLAVVPGFGDGEHLEVLVDPVGDLVQDGGALGDGGLAPGRVQPCGRRPGPARCLRRCRGPPRRRPCR